MSPVSDRTPGRMTPDFRTQRSTVISYRSERSAKSEKIPQNRMTYLLYIKQILFLKGHYCRRIFLDFQVVFMVSLVLNRRPRISDFQSLKDCGSLLPSWFSNSSSETSEETLRFSRQYNITYIVTLSWRVFNYTVSWPGNLVFYVSHSFHVYEYRKTS